MVVKRALTAQGCCQCRSAVLKLFTNPTSPIHIARSADHLITRSKSLGPGSSRGFSSMRDAKFWGNQQLDEQTVEDGSKAEIEEGQPDPPQDASAADVPWYLQVEPPRHVASIEPPPLPEVPLGSPAVIGSLLEFISEELGLDELSLLDLRELDPPPALGPKLFMLFGTARSERHLHVSAGRLVRWLKYKHRIWADADGLLGPNERKKKLRRKEKRAKLLGTMGTDDADDGLRTGWICVNLGTIGRGGGESTIVGEDGRVAGFGVAQSGSTIVIQIMTESRRAELDLETLWKNALEPPTTEPPTTEEPLPQKTEPRERIKRSDNLHPLEKALMIHSPTRPTARNGRTKDSHVGQASFYSTMWGSVVVNKADPLRDFSPEAVSHRLNYDADQKVRVLELLRARLDGLESLDVSRALGSQTPFTRLFELACKHLPKNKTWEYRLAIQAKAREADYDAAFPTLDDARDLLQQMRVSGIEASREQYLQLLRCISGARDAETNERSELALELLRTMYQRGQGILANDVIATLIESQLLGHSRRFDRRLVQRLRTLAAQAELPCMDEPTLIRLMTAYANRGQWGAVWAAWRMPPRHLRPRSRAMYLTIFQLAAQTQSPQLCTLVARQCFQGMIAEDPPVRPVGDVRDELMRCIEIADPHARLHADRIPPDAKGYGARLLNREFVKLVMFIERVF